MNSRLDPYEVSPVTEERPPFAWYANPDTNRVEFNSADCGLVGPYDFEDEAVNALIRIVLDNEQ